MSKITLAGVLVLALILSGCVATRPGVAEALGQGDRYVYEVVAASPDLRGTLTVTLRGTSAAPDSAWRMQDVVVVHYAHAFANGTREWHEFLDPASGLVVAHVVACTHVGDQCDRHRIRYAHTGQPGLLGIGPLVHAASLGHKTPASLKAEAFGTPFSITYHSQSAGTDSGCSALRAAAPGMPALAAPREFPFHHLNASFTWCTSAALPDRIDTAEYALELLRRERAGGGLDWSTSSSREPGTLPGLRFERWTQMHPPWGKAELDSFPVPEAIAWALANDEGFQEYVATRDDPILRSSTLFPRGRDNALGVVEVERIELTMWFEDRGTRTAYVLGLEKREAHYLGESQKPTVSVQRSEPIDPARIAIGAPRAGEYVTLASAWGFTQRVAADDHGLRWVMTNLFSTFRDEPLGDRHHYVFRYQVAASGGFALGITFDVFIDSSTGRLVRMDVPMGMLDALS